MRKTFFKIVSAVLLTVTIPVENVAFAHTGILSEENQLAEIESLNINGGQLLNISNNELCEFSNKESYYIIRSNSENEKVSINPIISSNVICEINGQIYENEPVEINEYVNTITIKSKDELYKKEYYLLFQDNANNLPLFNRKDIDSTLIYEMLDNKIDFDMKDSFWGLFKNLSFNSQYDLNNKRVYDLTKHEYVNVLDYSYAIMELIIIGENPYNYRGVNYVDKLLSMKETNNEELIIKYIALKAAGENISQESVKEIAINNEININDRALALSVVSHDLDRKQLLEISMDIKEKIINEESIDYAYILMGINEANINLDYYEGIFDKIKEKSFDEYDDKLIVALGNIVSGSNLWNRLFLLKDKIENLIIKGENIINDETITSDKSNLIKIIDEIKLKMTDNNSENLGYTYYCLYDEVAKYDKEMKPNVILDSCDPTGKIIIGDNEYTTTKEVNNIFSDNKLTVSISGEDFESSIKLIEYKIISELNDDSYNDDGWVEYVEPLTIEGEDSIILARITDAAGHTIYINSDKYIFEKTDDEDASSIGKVKVIIENNTAKDESVPWNGKILQFNSNIYEGSTINSLINYVFEKNNINYDQIEDGTIVDINKLTKGLLGDESKWLLSINDYLLKDNYSNLPVYDGDVIKLMYTTNNGQDILEDESIIESSLNELSFDIGVLDKEFSSDNLEYTLTLPEGTDNINIYAKANNSKNIVIKNNTTGFIGKIPYRDKELVPVNNDDEIYIIVGNNEDDVKIYKIKIIIDVTLDLYDYGTNIESPQLYQTSIDFYFKAKGKGKLSYRFIAIKDGKCEYVRAYSEKDTGTWIPTSGGVYTLYFKVKDSTGKEISKTITYKIIQPLTINDYGINSSEDYVIGDDIELYTKATGEGNLKYRFVVIKNGESVYSRSYNSKNKAFWKPTQGGTYTIYFKVKNNNGEEVSKTMNYTISQPLEFKDFGVNEENYNGLGDSFTLFANAVGEGDLKYRFVVMKNGKSIFTRGYKKSNTTLWTPNQNGEYIIYFKVKDENGVEIVRTFTLIIEEEEKEKDTYIEFIPIEDLNFTGDWTIVENKSAYLNKISISNNLGDSIEYSFNGIGANINYLAGPNCSNLLIQVDQEYITLNTYNEEELYMSYSIKDLKDGEHIIKIINLGKNEKSDCKINYLSIEKKGKYNKEEIDINRINELEEQYKKDVNIDLESNNTDTLYPSKVYQLNRYADTFINPSTLKLSYKNRGVLVYDFKEILDKKINKAVLKVTNDKAKVHCDGKYNYLYVGLLLDDVDDTVSWKTIDESTDVKWFSAEKVYWLEKWYTGNTVDVTELIKYVVDNKINTKGIVLKWVYGNVVNPIIVDNYDVKASLIVDYSEDLNIEQKIENGSKQLINNYKNNKYGWISVPIYSSLMTLYKDYGREDALVTLKSFFDRYIDAEGNVILTDDSIANLTVYEAEFGKILLDLYKITNEEKYLKAVNNTILAYNNMENGIYLVDGGEITELSYFGLPFLVEYSDFTGDSSYLDTAVRQAINLYGYMLSEQEDRIMLTLSNYINSKGWSRGIGWYYAGLAKMLSYDSVKNHKDYDILVNIFKEISNLLLEYQHESGLWSSIIHKDDYFEETSGTALFISGMDIGLKEGLLPEKFVHAKYKAIEGLCSKMIIGAEITNVFQFNTRNNHLENREENTSDIGWGLAMEALLNNYSS